MNHKERGELSELAFLYKATGLGFHVSKPYGDSSRYDFIVEHLGRLSKVQVKSTGYMRSWGAYEMNLQHRLGRPWKPYCAGDFDFFACYVIPTDTWYIIPFNEVPTSVAVWLNPTRPNRDRRFGCYREAWHLLEGWRKSSDVLLTFNIDACDESVVRAVGFRTRVDACGKNIPG